MARHLHRMDVNEVDNTDACMFRNGAMTCVSLGSSGRDVGRFVLSLSVVDCELIRETLHYFKDEVDSCRETMYVCLT